MGLKYKFEYRIVCAKKDGHSGPMHAYTKRSMQAAFDDARLYNETAKAPGTITWCLPFRAQAREISEWYDLEES